MIKYKTRFVVAAIVICCCYWVYSKVWESSAVNDKQTTTSLIANKKYPNKKYILGWTKFFGQPMTGQHLWACPELNCEITLDRNLLKKSGALIFHIVDLNWGDLPPIRLPHQYYALMSHESPMVTSHVNLNGGGQSFFNISLTYRQDSDVYFPYSAFSKRSTPTTTDDKYLNEIVKNKTKLVAWFSSNCNPPSKRDSYVAELEKYIKIDKYGKCGTLSCPRQDDYDKCEQMLSRDYKFYLAFENANCLNYVTEKFIIRVRNRLVPVVLWKRNYVNYAPPHSFISVEDFRHPRDLADYLKYLANNVEEYKKYLTWQDQYETNACTENRYCGFCRLCEMIQAEKVEQKISNNMHSWWYNSSTCYNDLVPDLLKNAKKN